jgi:hypothetical protein
MRQGFRIINASILEERKLMDRLLNIKVEGVNKTLLNLADMYSEFPHEFAEALYGEAENIMTESKREIPVDTGTARDSGFVEEPKFEEGKVSVSLGYGGAASKINPKTGEPSGAYIIPLHERQATHHGGQKWKFLEDPMKRRAPVLRQELVARMKKITEKRRAVS